MKFNVCSICEGSGQGISVGDGGEHDVKTKCQWCGGKGRVPDVSTETIPDEVLGVKDVKDIQQMAEVEKVHILQTGKEMPKEQKQELIVGVATPLSNPKSEWNPRILNVPPQSGSSENTSKLLLSLMIELLQKIKGEANRSIVVETFKQFGVNN